MDLEYWRTCSNYCLGLKSTDINNANDQCWRDLLEILRDALAMVPFNKMRFQYLVQIILTTHQLATYIFDMLDISADECRCGLVPSIAQELREKNLDSVLQLEVRPRCAPWQRFMDLLCHDQMVIGGFGCENDKIVLHDTFGIECIDRPNQRRYVSRNPSEHRLDHQFQWVDFQKVLGPSHMPSVAGYDCEDPDPLNLPIRMGLDVCAKTGLTYMSTERFCAAIFQEAIHKHNRVGHTEPKLFQYHDEAIHLTKMIYAPTEADHRIGKMERRGLEKWVGVEHAKTLSPNRQCWEAVKKWIYEDGEAVNYMLQIRDRTYNLSNAISNIKKSMENFTAQTKRGWHIQNIVKFLFNFLVSKEGQILKQRKGIDAHDYLTHWRQAMCVTCQIPFKSDERMFNPRTNRLNHNINDIGQIVSEHDERSTIYYGNDGVRTFVTAYIAATQVDDSKMGIRHQKHWHRMEFVHQFVYTLRDFLLKPIWSAKQLSANLPIDIHIDHRMRLLQMADRICSSSDERCREIAVHQGCSLNVAHVDTSIMIICWERLAECVASADQAG